MVNGVVGVPQTIDEAVALLRQAASSKQSYGMPNSTGNNRGSVHNKAFAGIIGSGGGAGGSNFLLQTKKAYISSQKKQQL